MKIIHIDQNHPTLIEALNALGFTNEEAYTTTKEAVEANIAQYDGVIIRSRFKIDKTFIDQAKNLKFIGRVGAGLESIDTEYAISKGITLFAAPEGNRNAVGEHTLGMLLSLYNKLNIADQQIREGQWLREENRGLELDGKTVSIIGYGNMGRAFARKLRGFDVEVICYDLREDIEDSNATQVSLEEIFEKTDILSLHTPWNPTTDRMINADFIAKFHKPFLFLNTARGKSVVTEDVVAALQSGKIIGAGLDVLEYENASFESLFTNEKNMPKPLQMLLTMKNVILSPHIAGWTVESKEKLAQTIVAKIQKKFVKPMDITIEKHLK